ncbi:FAD-dependent oxidoreductase [Chloroflexota bacterium]
MSDKLKFKKLLEPAQVGRLALRNRIVMAPMGNELARNFVTESLKAYFAARAKGGAGLIIVADAVVSFPVGGGRSNLVLVHDDKFIPGLSELVEAVHKYGSRIMLQLNHFGPADQFSITNQQPVAASAISRSPDFAHPNYWLPRELSTDEISDIVMLFANAAGRARKAGFDGIEIHAAARYLINSFLSPHWNQRQDNYGGDLPNRTRFLLEVVRATRELVGPDYPIWCRINSEERDIEDGIIPGISKELAPMLEKVGVDVIDVVPWPPHSPAFSQGFNLADSAVIKKVVGIPVMTGGRIDVALGEKLLRQGKADFICIGRALIADPELPNKVASGKLDEVTPCVSCNCCLAPQRSCTVNAARGREAEYEIKPAQKQKKVMVIGGGPGGMEAARVAALRGHRVTLYEKGYQLGGQLIPASLLRSEYGDFLRYLASQMKKLGVEVRLKQEVYPGLIAEVKPDAVVLATGATSALPPIPGMDSGKVLSSGEMQRMMSGHRGGRLLWSLGAILLRGKLGFRVMQQVLKFWAPFGRRAVVMGIGLGGCEMADFLVGKGKKVTIVDTGEDIPFGEPPMTVLRQFWKDRVVKRGGVILTGVKYLEVNDDGLVIERDGERQTLKADSIVFAAEYQPDTALAESLKNASYEIHLVGDCVTPCGILEAVRDGSRVGRLL